MVADTTTQSDLDAPGLVRRLRATYATGRTRDFGWRDAQLAAIERMLTDNEQALVDALHTDLGRPAFEGWFADVRALAREVEGIRKQYRRWAGEQKASTELFFKPGRSSVRFDPLGTVLVIAPWNYPIQLLVSPLAAAVAAGNTVVCKPSEMAPATSAVLSRLAAEYLDPDAIVFVEGGIPESTALLEQRWDHILYTGNGAVGRIVMAAAAKHLTPVTLELGGRSPTIVDRSANLALAVERIASGRFINAGQTCIAPNHVFVHADVEEEFTDRLVKSLRRRYGKDPKASRDFGRIVNERHVERIAGLIAAGGYEQVAYGGESSVAEKYVAPTVLGGVSPDAAVMQEEIFGPVLPVLRFTDIEEPIAQINAGDKPLALYVFAKDDDVVEKVLAETSSGGVSVNETLMHFATGELPFGGVGESGMGAYHGQTGFETFSHRKAVYRRPSWFREPRMMQPPYKPWKARLMRRIF